MNSPVLSIISTGVDQRTLWSGGSQHIGLRISNYGENAIQNGSASWALTAEGARLDGGEISGVQVPLGDVADVGQIVLHAPDTDHPRKLELVITVTAGPVQYNNRWDFWEFPKKNLLSEAPGPIELQAEWPELHRVYPWLRTSSNNIDPKSLLITETLNEGTMAHLRQGGRVLLIMKQKPSDHGIPFFPDSGGAMGTLIPDPAALGDFPNQGFADLQFYNLLNGASPIPLDAWPAELKPIVGALRTTSGFLSQQKGLSRVGYIFQARVGAGELLVTSPGLWNHYDDLHPAAIYLFDRLLRYASASNLAPGHEVSNALLQSLQAK